MAQFEYQAKDGPTKVVTGSITAKDRSDAVTQLSDKGIVPLSINEVKEKGKRNPSTRLLKRGVSLNDIHMVTFQLEELIASGLPMHTALGSISTHIDHPTLSSVFYELEKQVTEGKSLSESLEGFPAIFSPFYVNMVKAGEESGQLAEVLNQLAIVYEKEHDLKVSIQQALAYPALIAIAGIGTIVVILMFIIPRLESMYEDIGKGLPFVTSVIISVSTFLQSFWWVIGIGLVALCLYCVHLTRNHAAKGRVIDFAIRAVPLWGTLLQKEEISRFVRSLSMLFQSGIAILDALVVSKKVLRSEKLKKEIENVHERVRTGQSLHESMAASKAFSPFIINMITTGERTGNLERSLNRVNRLYDKEIGATIKVITTLIEPLLVLIIGCVVGVIVIGMLLPIFQINVFLQ